MKLWIFCLSLIPLSLLAQPTPTRFPKVVPTIAELIASNPNDNMTNVWVMSTPCSGKAALWQWRSGDTTPSTECDAYESTHPSNPDGRWIKVSLDIEVPSNPGGTPITNYTFLTVANLAEMKNLSVTNGVTAVLMRGNFEEQDGGEGIFTYEAGSTEQEDGGRIHAPNNGTGNPGKWKRVQFGDDVYVKWWNPIGTNGIIQAAMDYASSLSGPSRRPIVHLQAGTNYLDSTQPLLAKSNIRLVGQTGAILAAADNPSTNSVLLDLNGAENFTLENVAVVGWNAGPIGGNTNNTGYAILARNCTNIVLGGIVQRDFYTGFIKISTNVDTATFHVFDELWRENTLLGWGGDPTGLSDCRSAMTNALLCAQSIYIPEGSWKFDMNQRTTNIFQPGFLNLRSGQLIEAHPGALMFMADAYTNSVFFYGAAGVSNVVIRGGTWRGYRYDVDDAFFHTNFATWGLGGYFGSFGDMNNLLIENLMITNMGRGGLSIGGATNVTLKRVIIAGGRQNNLEITKGADMLFDNCQFLNSHSLTNNDPQAGCDIEPNSGDGVQRVTFKDCLFYGNRRGLYAQKAGGLCLNDVIVDNCRFMSNYDKGMLGVNITNLTVSGSSAFGNADDGFYFEGVKGLQGGTMMGRTNGGNGVTVIFGTNNTINGLVATDNGESGVQVNTGGLNLMGGNISSNQLRGVAVSEGTRVNISTSIIRANRQEGIRYQQSFGGNIQGNIIEGNGQNGDNTIGNISLENNTSWVNIVANSIRKMERYDEGAVAGSTVGSVTLSGSASDVDNWYVGLGIFVTSGSGSPSSNTITAYNGTTKIATLSVPWSVQPAIADTYETGLGNRSARGIDITTSDCTHNTFPVNDDYKSGQTATFRDLGTLNDPYLTRPRGGSGSSNPSHAFTSNLTLTNGSLSLPNTKGIIIKDSAGVEQLALIGDAGDNLVLQALDQLGDITFKSADGETRGRIMGGSLVGQWRLYKDGTTGQPAITWQTNSTTGIYQAASDVIGFTAANGERFRIAATGVQISGSNSVTGATYYPASTTQTLAAGEPLLANATRVRVQGSGGAVTCTAAPTIADATVDGQFLIIRGTSNVNTWTLQDMGTLPNSNVNLSAASITLGQGDTVILQWDADGSRWYQAAPVSNNL